MNVTGVKKTILCGPGPQLHFNIYCTSHHPLTSLETDLIPNDCWCKSFSVAKDLFTYPAPACCTSWQCPALLYVAFLLYASYLHVYLNCRVKLFESLKTLTLNGFAALIVVTSQKPKPSREYTSLWFNLLLLWYTCSKNRELSVLPILVHLLCDKIYG